MKSRSRKQASLHERPPYTYATLIGFAIISSKEYRLTLGEIYEAIITKYPYYKLGDKGWKNSVRHNLSLKKNLFRKLKVQSTSSNSIYWTVTPSFAKVVAKFHDFKAKL